DLARAVIESNAAIVFETIQTKLESRPPAERILGYLDWMITGQLAEGRSSGHFAGCPFGKLAAETAGHEPVIRDAVEKVFQKLMNFIAGAIRELAPDLTEKQIKAHAQRMFMSWQGALLLSQARNSAQPLKHARQLSFEILNSPGEFR
ncbi:MAG: TetR family transcriptional regulator C-terminal domain-containing protein, partial [Leptospirales bacterium]